MIKTGFHYISEKNWGELVGAGQPLKPQTRLVRLRSVTDLEIPKLPDWAHSGYIYAFPDHLAEKAWEDYRHVNRELEILMRDIGTNIIILQFDVLLSDRAFVVDRSHYSDYQWGANSDKKDAIRRYALSRVSAKKYRGGFLMPELLIGNPLEIDRLKVHSRFTRQIRTAS